MDLTMVPFDGMQSLDTSDSSLIFKGTPIKEHLSGAFLMIECAYFDRAVDYYRPVVIAFSPDFDLWMYYDLKGEAFYVGSVSGTYTVQELYEYFNPMITGSWPNN
jgi:hypothetical protein